MIFILSKEDDISTDKVLIHLIQKNISFFRFDLPDIILSKMLDIKISNIGFSINIHNHIITNDNIKNHTFWYRKMTHLKESEQYIKLKESVDNNILSLIESEYESIKDLFFNLTANGKWLGSNTKINKGYALFCANKFKLNIPSTLITGKKTTLEKFVNNSSKDKNRTICKTTGDGFTIKLEEKKYLISPQIIDSTNKLPDYFFPSMIQTYIDKEYDIRIFYINGRCYTSAIFSQTSKKTKVDFRLESMLSKRLKITAYKLPIEIEQKIKKLMEYLKLNTGSIDMLYSQGIYIFLEINPSGQFGYYANISGYDIYQIIAEELTSNTYEKY